MDYFNVVMGYIPIGMLRFEPNKVVKVYLVFISQYVLK